jgi:hypothetical protein
MAQSARAGPITLLGLVLLTLVGIASFLYGFLPLKPFLGGYSPAPEASTPPAFDRLVFMLVDGLRRCVPLSKLVRSFLKVRQVSSS